MDEFIDFLSYLFIGKIIRSNFFTVVMQNEEQSVNSHVEKYLNYYCNLKDSPEFAVLLKGDWGSGKTHFIKQYIKNSKRKKQKILYVSLYGMTSFSDIEFSFFQQLYPPFLTSKKMILIGKLFGNFIKSMFKFDLNSDGKDDVSITLQGSNVNLINSLADVGQNILIFDDLERCKIEVENILGYINNFVEHQGLKVIIIANENELNKNKKYLPIKEKLVGQTFDIGLDLKKALEGFILIVKTLDVEKFLSSNIDLIQNIYQETEYKNLRTLRQIVLDFERIYKELTSKVRENNELLQDTLRALIVFSVGIKCGDLQAKEIVSLQVKYVREISQQIRETQLDNSSEENNQEKDLLPNSLRKTYPLLVEPYSIFPSEMWWQTFFDTGVSDASKLEESIQINKHFWDENTPDWIKLWHHREFCSDDEFDKTFEKVKLAYESREYENIGEIKHIFGMFLMFSDFGIYSKSREEVLQDGKLYVDHLRKSSRSIFINSEVEHEWNSHKTLVFYELKTQEFQKFCIYLIEAQKDAVKDSMLDEAQNLLDIMQNNVSQFYRILHPDCKHDEGIVIRRYREIPILKFLSVQEFVNKLLSMSFNDQQEVFWALAGRYKLVDIYDQLLHELDWLRNLRSTLLEEVDRKYGKISGLILKSYIDHYLDKLIHELETKKRRRDS